MRCERVGRIRRLGRLIPSSQSWRATRTGCEMSPGPRVSASGDRTSPVRDRSVALSLFLSVEELTACEYQDKTVFIWTQDSPRAPWSKVALEPTPTAGVASDGKFGDVVWRVSWSVSGNVLAVSSGAFLLRLSYEA